MRIVAQPRAEVLPPIDTILLVKGRQVQRPISRSRLLKGNGSFKTCTDYRAYKDYTPLRMEAEDAERERYEEERIMREKEQKARREAEEERKHKEEERLKEQEKERVRKTLEEALERAKHEAEITRKARVFKHVLEGAEKSPELERRLLGVDPETGDRILHEVFIVSPWDFV
ncbi:hypothetical protein TELCIR_20667 [Teladorsagia circumcincta]|uniref:Uncharacterized protein n=1 Tax=Teladorsagia circumcincta TaxID=45464 RepID=A0A2G9TK72_TELCI|nr:hypothetical protein TELCIR_20667 [Teladorsagia circumcincta]